MKHFKPESQPSFYRQIVEIRTYAYRQDAGRNRPYQLRHPSEETRMIRKYRDVGKNHQQPIQGADGQTQESQV